MRGGPREIRRYSGAFKRKVVGEIERGEIRICEARELYGIGGSETIQKWIKKHGKNHLLSKVVRIQMVDERDQLRELKREKKELESALAQAHLKILAMETLLEVASEKAGYDIKKKDRIRSITRLAKEKGLKIRGLCRAYGISRQGYYQQRRRQKQAGKTEARVLAMVREERREQPKIGTRKLHELFGGEWAGEGLRVGRDKLFDILRRNGMLVRRRKKYIRTTNSLHRYYVHENLIEGRRIEEPNEVYVADITYLRTRRGFVYLPLVTDVASRKIVGWDVSDSLSVEGSLRSLRMALRGAKPRRGSIHHSDRGIQYCCDAYTEELRREGIAISMAEKGNPYQNAIAERINGILKEEYQLRDTFADLQEAKKAVAEAIYLYNHRRPHMSINYEIPAERYAQRLRAAA